MPENKNGPTSQTRNDGLGATPVVVDMEKGMGSTPVSSVVDPFAAAGVRPSRTGGDSGSGTSSGGSTGSGSSGKK